MKYATLTLRQELHDNLKQEPRGAGKTYASHKIPFERGYCVAIGRNPLLTLCNEVVYIPSNFITRHIGYIRCAENSREELLHILNIDTVKTDVFNYHTQDKIIKQHIFKNGDCLKFDSVPVFLEYKILEDKAKDTGDFKNTIW